MMANKQGIATHYLRYSTGSALVIMAGLVSFPVLTRLLDNTQYGILGYYDTWLLMAVAIGKLGAQHAIMRFYPHGGDAQRLRAFSTNLFYLPLAISLGLWAAVGLGVIVIDLATGARQSGVFWLVAAAAPLMVFASLVETVLRVTENSRLVTFTRVGWRWLELVLMLGAVVLLQHSAFAAYGGKLAAAVLVIVFYARWMRDNLGFSRSALDPASLREGLVYGLPLVANEIVAVALVTLDRLMIKGIMGDFAAVGIYSIGASLAMQVNVFMNLAVFEAFTPMANRLYMTEGAAAVRALKARVLLPMTYAAVGIAALLWCFGTDVIIALSGSAKAASGPVFAMVGMVYALQPVLLVAGYGLLLEKRTVKVLSLMCGSLAVNATLNLLWIPTYGVMGAVYATAVSSAALAIAHCAWVPRELMKLPDLRTVTSAVAIALACVAAVWASDLFGLTQGWPRLLVGGSAMGALYALGALLLDARLRAMVAAWRRGRSSPRLSVTN